MNLKSEYKYIYFILIHSKPKTEIFECRNKNSEFILGTVMWYPAWRQYCYFPESNTIINTGCLQDIKEFVDSVNKRYKIMRKRRTQGE